MGYFRHRDLLQWDDLAMGYLRYRDILQWDDLTMGYFSGTETSYNGMT